MPPALAACSCLNSHSSRSSSNLSFVVAAYPLTTTKSPPRTAVPSKQKSYTGSLVVRKKSILDITDIGANLCDGAAELLGRSIDITLLSTDKDPDAKSAKVSQKATISGWLFTGSFIADEDVSFKLEFTLEDDFGEPGALFVRNLHPNEFYLKSVEVTPNDGSSTIEFNCHSWIYNSSTYRSGERVFYANKLCLPKDTPAGLLEIRKRELESLRGTGTGERQPWDRVYDYDIYNDLGNPDQGESLRRPSLGGSEPYPFPRRLRTGRPPSSSDETAESRGSGDFYIPADELFTTSKNSNFLADSITAFVQIVPPFLEKAFTRDSTFDTFDELRKLYVDGFDLEKQLLNVNKIQKATGPFTFINALFSPDDGSFLQYPLPQVIQADEGAWMSDKEFARQMLSGQNPVAIQQLKEFPPRSSLDPDKYGPQLSAITEKGISSYLEGQTVAQAMEEKKLFILDYHDVYLPYLEKINGLRQTHSYASRTLLYLQADGTLKPVAIELSLPRRSRSRVYHPAASGEMKWLWDLAKAHVTGNDSGYHQLVSHFLRTHGALEPFIIATHRHLSALHPLYTFLLPHYKATLSINSKARQSLINANGVIERTFTPRRYAMELCSAGYKGWRFNEQALPADLLSRGMATKDASSKSGVKLVLEDYPYAADGLEVWGCIEKWTQDYINICYKDDSEVASDAELQAWWNEIVTVGHADIKDGWVKLDCKKNLREVLTTVIWLASGHHAAVNFGQYAYSGYMPNHPTATHKPVPETGSSEYYKLYKDPEEFFLSAVSNKIEATLVMTTIEILSTHATDEEYLGQRVTKNWTNNQQVHDAFARFSESLKEVEDLIKSRNMNARLKNRLGPARVPYTLLYPRSRPGITGQGIPNSVSI